jgi:hypothetical protein
MAINAEQLNIILSARDKEFTKAMERSQKRVEQFSMKSQKNLSATGKSFDVFGKKAKTLGGILAASLSVAAFSRAVDATIEIGNLSTVAGVAVDRFKVLSMATREFGVGQAKLSDILKDVNDKFGDYVQTGAGPLADFFDNIAPKVGLTATAFDKLSSEQKLGAYIKALRDANVSQADMTFYMEAIASDATLLVPAFDNNSAAINEMDAKLKSLGITMTNETVEKARATRLELDLMSQTISTNLNEALVNIGPLLIAASGGMATISKYARQFMAAMDMLSDAQLEDFNIDSVEDEISSLEDRIKTISETQLKLMGNKTFGGLGDLEKAMFEGMSAEIKQRQKELADLQDRLKSLKGEQTGPAPLIGIAVDPHADVIRANIAAIQEQINKLREKSELNKLDVKEQERLNIGLEKQMMIQRMLNEMPKGTMSEVDFALRQEIHAIADAWEEAAIAASTVINPVKEVKDETLLAADAMDKFLANVIKGSPLLQSMGFEVDGLRSTMDLMKSSMEDAFMGIVDGTMTAKDAFKSMASSVIKELFRVLVVQRLVGNFATGTISGSGILGFIGGAAGVGAASGRSVQAGQQITVGEHGREPFVPSQNGRILSVGQAKSAIAGGGEGVTVYQTINVSTGVAQTVRSEIKAMMPQIADNTKAAVLDAKRRGGAYGRAF